MLNQSKISPGVTNMPDYVSYFRSVLSSKGIKNLSLTSFTFYTPIQPNEPIIDPQDLSQYEPNPTVSYYLVYKDPISNTSTQYAFEDLDVFVKALENILYYLPELKRYDNGVDLTPVLNTFS